MGIPKQNSRVALLAVYAARFMHVCRAARVVRVATPLCLVGFLLIASCEPQLVDDPIPIVAFNDIVLDLNFPENTALRNAGGFRELSRGGVRGIILYRNTGNQFFAFERNCSYRPGDACATVNVHVSGLFLTDPCCNSSFDFTSGAPTGGPAWRPLLQYRAELVGSVLTITDDILN